MAPIKTDVVLVGGGHAHVSVLRMFAMRPEPGLRLTLVAKELMAPYSGMLPGLVAGLYRHEEAHIDLARLAAFAGARLIHGAVDGLDLADRRVRIAGRPPLAYDLLSIDVGITPHLEDVPGAERFALPVKPISTFWPRWSALKARALRPDGPRRFVVVGGGAAGFELVLAVAATLRADAGRAGLTGDAFAFTLVTGDTLLAGLAPRAGRLARAALQRATIDLVDRDRAVSVDDTSVELASGRRIAADAVLMTTRAEAPAWFAATGLALDPHGYLALRPTLQSIGRGEIFAAGDCAAVLDHPRPKAGVFAVRQGPVLAGNLRRSARGERLRPFRPQSRFLTLLSTADGRAIAARGRFALDGAFAFRWKDWIDRRFMARFNDLPAMPEAETMRCAGCAAKIGPATLAAALDRFGAGAPRDDAAVIEEADGGLRLETVDHFRAPWSDPYVLGRIAAHHAAGDILAMGGRPTHAQAIAVLPVCAPRIAAEDLFQLIAGARASFAELGVDLIGGHSAEGAELAVGFAVSGKGSRDTLLPKGGLRPGDRLVLTRPIGTGVLLAGAMRLKTRGPDLFAALQEMQRAQGDAAALLARFEAHAATDVTGFGLAGHCLEMLEASGTSARLDLDAIPLHPGARELARSGIASTLLQENLAFADRLAGDIKPEVLTLIFDPQTAGGLLAGLPGNTADEAVAALRAAGHRAAVIGVVEERGSGPARLTIRGSFAGQGAEPANAVSAAIRSARLNTS